MEQQGQHQIMFSGDDRRICQQPLPYSEITVQRPGWTKLLVLAGVSTSVGCSLPVGYNIGVVNTPAYILQAFCNESLYTRFDTVLTRPQLDILWSSIVSIFLVGGAIGSLGGSYLADKIGRKGGITVANVLGALAAVLFFCANSSNSVEMLFCGRLIVGLSAGLITSVMPMYLTELSPPELKGATGAICPLGVTIGVLLGQIISMYDILGNENYWPYCLAFYILPLLLCSLTMSVLPESPKYLFVIKNQPYLALKQLQRIRNTNEELLQDEVQELKLEEHHNSREGSSWNLIRVVTNSSLLLPLMLVCSLQAGQQFSGINAVFYYSSKIFEKAGLSRKSSELATIGAGCCNLLMAILALPVLSKFSRRGVIRVSLISTTVFLIVLGLATSFIDATSWMPYISIVGVLGYVICYGIGLGPIPYFIGSELFEVGPRPSAMAWGSMANWAGNFLIGLTFPTLQSWIGAGSFFIFALIVVGLLVFIWIYLPETRGKDPSEISPLVGNGLKSRPLEAHVPVATNDSNNTSEKTFS